MHPPLDDFEAFAAWWAEQVRDLPEPAPHSRHAECTGARRYAPRMTRYLVVGLWRETLDEDEVRSRFTEWVEAESPAAAIAQIRDTYGSGALAIAAVITGDNIVVAE